MERASILIFFCWFPGTTICITFWYKRRPLFSLSPQQLLPGCSWADQHASLLNSRQLWFGPLSWTRPPSCSAARSRWHKWFKRRQFSGRLPLRIWRQNRLEGSAYSWHCHPKHLTAQIMSSLFTNITKIQLQGSVAVTSAAGKAKREKKNHNLEYPFSHAARRIQRGTKVSAWM